MRQLSPSLLEIFHQQLDRQAALHLELACRPPSLARSESARARCRCRRSRRAGRLSCARALRQDHRQRIGFLPALDRPPTRCAVAPTAAARPCSRGRACVRKCANGLSSRKKKLSLVVIASMTSRSSCPRRHRLRMTLSASASRSRSPCRFRIGRQARFQQVDLVRPDHQAGAAVQQRREHVEAIAVSCCATSLSAMLEHLSAGDLRQRQHRAGTARPARSRRACPRPRWSPRPARSRYRRRRPRARVPARPSWPMPVSITTSTRPPQACAALRSIGSTDGPAEILRRVVGQPGAQRPCGCPRPANAGRPAPAQIRPGCSGSPSRRLGAGHAAELGQMLGQDRREGRRHVLGQHHGDRQFRPSPCTRVNSACGPPVELPIASNSGAWRDGGAQPRSRRPRGLRRACRAAAARGP